MQASVRVSRERREERRQERHIVVATAMDIAVRAHPHYVIGDALADATPVVGGHAREKPLDDVHAGTVARASTTAAAPNAGSV